MHRIKEKRGTALFDIKLMAFVYLFNNLILVFFSDILYCNCNCILVIHIIKTDIQTQR